MHALMCQDESILLFLYDFAIFRKLNQFIKNCDKNPGITLDRFYQSKKVELVVFYEERVQEYTKIMKMLLFSRVFALKRSDVMKPKYQNTASYQNMELFFDHMDKK